MSKSVAKGNYVKGRLGIGKAFAHLNYIEKRPGEDRKEGGRVFYSDTRDNVSTKYIRSRIEDQKDGPNSVVMHRVVLSPGLNTTDLEAYTREIMTQLSNRKGQELEWYAVNHRNTDHCHVHLCIMGKAEDESLVRLYRSDYKAIRAEADFYLDREHGIERFVDWEARRILQDREFNGLSSRWLQEESKRIQELRHLEYGFSKGLDIDKGSTMELLIKEEDMSGSDKVDQKEKDRRAEEAARKAESNRLEWELLNKRSGGGLEDGSRGGEIFRVTGKQYRTEMEGRYVDVHERVQAHMTKEYLRGLKDERPDLFGYVEEEISRIDYAMRHSRHERFMLTSFDKLISDIDRASSYENIDMEILFKEDFDFDKLVDSSKSSTEIEGGLKIEDIESDGQQLEKLIDPKVERQLEEEVTRASEIEPERDIVVKDLSDDKDSDKDSGKESAPEEEAGRASEIESERDIVVKDLSDAKDSGKEAEAGSEVVDLGTERTESEVEFDMQGFEVTVTDNSVPDVQEAKEVDREDDMER